MRKTASLLALLLGISSLLLSVSAGSTSDVSFAEAIHQRSAGYPAQFQVFTAVDETCTVSIHKSLYGVEKGAALWAQVQKDVARIKALKSAETHAPSVYIVPETLGGSVEMVGQRLYCTAEDVLSGAYRPALAGVMLDTAEPWLMTGISACAFGETWDDAALKQHYAAAEGLHILSLFAAYFCEDFVGQELAALARGTAASLCSHVIGKEGVDALLAEGQQFVQPWLAALGVERSYENPYARLFDGFRYTADKQYPFIVTSPKGDVYFFKPGEASVDTPEQVQEALAESIQGMDAILAHIQQHAPEVFPVIAANYAEPIYYYFGGLTRATNRSIATGDRRALLLHSTTLLHEAVHILLRANANLPIKWHQEAMAEYLPSVVNRPHHARQRYYHALVEPFQGNSADAQFVHLVQELYFEEAGKPARPEDVDVLLFLKSCGKARFLKPDLPISMSFFADPIHNRRPNQKPVEGDELTYSQAMAFANYLINKHGLAPMLTLCLDKEKSFKDVFEIEFSEAMAKFLDSMQGN